MLERLGDPVIAAAAVAAGTVATGVAFVAQQAANGIDASTGVLATVLAVGTAIVGALWKKIRDDAAAAAAAAEKAEKAAQLERDKHDRELAEQRRKADKATQDELQRLRDRVDELTDLLLGKGTPEIG